MGADLNVESAHQSLTGNPVKVLEVAIHDKIENLSATVASLSASSNSQANTLAKNGETKSNSLLTSQDGEEKPTVDEYVDEEPGISFNAIVGLTRGNMMKVLVQLAGSQIIALLDSGSTDNFIDEDTAVKLGLPIKHMPALRVLVANGDRISTIGDKEITWSAIEGAPLSTLHSMQPSSSHEEALPLLLNSFEGIFAEVTTLPPSRECDHRIILRSGSDPVAVRPYRYPQLLKNEIERQCIDMIQCGIIRPSRSPFASPCLLVREEMAYLSSGTITPSRIQKLSTE
nr:putative mitochondrial protein [Ipomoea batatas]